MLPKYLRIQVSSPASVANMGAGFDCLALAVGLRNEFTMYVDMREREPGEKEFEIDIRGRFGDRDRARLSSPKTNLFAEAFSFTIDELCRLAKVKEPKCPIMIAQEVRIPPVRGLGSSSSACVAGVVAAIEMLRVCYKDRKFPDFRSAQERELCASLAMATDNCPDNVCASLSGGLTYALVEDREWPTSSAYGRLHYFREPLDEHSDLRVVALVPNRMIPTEEARKVVEQASYKINDVSFNIQRSTCVPAIFRSKRYDLLREAMRDRVHQKQRAEEFFKLHKKSLSIDTIFEAVVAAGAYGACISGSGSTLVAFCERKKSEAISQAFRASFEQQAKYSDDLKEEDLLVLPLDSSGTQVEVSELDESHLPGDVALWARYVGTRRPMVLATVPSPSMLGPVPLRRPEVYVSYAWGEDSSQEGRQREEIVDRLCEAIRATGREIGRDKDRLRGGDSIERFGREIAVAPRIIAVISEKSLHSDFCMVYELFRAYQTCGYDKIAFQRKIIPLVLDDAKPFLSGKPSIALTKHWRLKYRDMQRDLRAVDPKRKNHDRWIFVDLMEDMAPRIPGLLDALDDTFGKRGFDAIVADQFREVIERLP